MGYGQLIGFLGLAAIALCWALAVVLYRVGSPGTAARKLSLLLAIEGVVLVTAGFPEFATGQSMVIFDEIYGEKVEIFLALYSIHHLGDAAMLALYPPFLALTVQTKLTRPFADRRVRVFVSIIALILFVFVMISGVRDSMAGPQTLYLAMTLMFAYGMVASIHAWRTAPSGLARERAGIFALAFGLRDLGWGLSYAIAAWLAIAGLLEGESAPFWLMKFVYALGTLFAVPLIAYGILRSHLFDIDLRVKWTIKQSTLAAIVVTLIFLISEGADRLLSAELGNFAGLFAAAIVVFFLAPLQRFADGIASKAMPNTENTPEYAAFRKMQVYEEAVAEAHYQGGISEKERALLVRLRDSLGISEADADAIESELTRHEPAIA